MTAKLGAALAVLAFATTPAHAETTGRVETFAYLVPDDTFLLPIASLDRGALHLEGRYQYEDRETASLWAGRAFETGDELALWITPMVGVVFGQTDGWAPGVEASLSWKRFELYTEAEHLFASGGDDGDFTYAWTQLGYTPLAWLTVGLSAQRTRLYASDVDIDRGLFAAARTGRFELSAYAFNLDRDDPFTILAAAVTF